MADGTLKFWKGQKFNIFTTKEWDRAVKALGVKFNMGLGKYKVLKKNW